MKKTIWTVVVSLLLCACTPAVQVPPPSPDAPPSDAPPATPPLPTIDTWVKALGKPVSRFAAYGDTRDGHEAHRQIIAAVVASNPELVLQSGDLVADSSVAAQWVIFEDITGKMRAKIPYYPARGNHDNEGGEFFEKLLPTKGVHREGFYYSFDTGRMHFVAIDTEDSLIETGPQYKWLEEDLKKARGEGKFIVPFYHKAIYSVGPHAMQKDVWALRPILHDLFRKYEVRLVFQGHDHIYYRTTRDGIVYVVTGGGGAPLYSSGHMELSIPGDVFERTHHFCVGDVYDDRVVVTAYRPNLTQVDSFTVAIPPPI